VTVYWGGQVNQPNPFWDTHFNNNRRLKDELLPPFDQCFSALLEDLHDRRIKDLEHAVLDTRFASLRFRLRSRASTALSVKGCHPYR
jgi:hypothetical protein